ncbi:hypothetical protein D0859_05268 [Hortaea werneckii]|uniref:C2H2-type domain-containing protein n=1 Tax=Hortaea werneckii TaxID=91943 RepID=A0A3M7IYS1_HORWE|nr:hypothetical protein D0859_05268 [Hortaea werneckii]
MRSNKTPEQESQYSPKPYQSAGPPPPKRRRLSEQVSASDGCQREESNATSETANLSSRRSPERAGSSRDRRGEMERSPSPAGSVRYTRTGRVSKAAKGQRVHTCDECGKTYTRAEHLRRHQQNHKPGAFPCDIPGCGRSFHRDDLLTRHKTRHSDSTGPPTRPQSVASRASSDAPAGVPAHGPPAIYPSVAAEKHDNNATEYYTHGFEPLENHRLPASRYELLHSSQPNLLAMHFDSLSFDFRKHCHHPFNELHLIDVPISIDGNGPEFASLDSSFAQTSTYHSPSAYESPPNGFTPTVSLPYYAHCSAHVDYFLDRRDSCMAYSNNKHRPSARPLSPVSASSSTSLVPPPWNDLDSATNMANLSSFSSWDGCYNSPGPNSLQREDYGQVIADDLVRMMAASERDDRESCDLIIPTTAPQEPWEETTFNDLAFTNEQRYLAAYWTWIHPQYPIVHKPTFDLDRTAPLLRASMLALGACMLQSRTDIENASAIHERCVKVLKCRSVEGTHTFRICDMQAIVLTEVYAIFKAQNLSAHFSPPFLQVYTLLENDHEALRHPSADEEYRSAFNFDGQRAEIDSQHGNGRAVDIACKQRLLSMCFILDQSNSAFFGRSQANCSAVAGHSLPFRQTASPRDASPRPQLDPEYDGRAASMPSFNMVSHALEALSRTSANAIPGIDAFQLEALMACISDKNFRMETFECLAAGPNNEPSLVSASKSSPQTRLKYHLHMLCRNTPVPSLLSVVGESWYVGDKLNSHHDYSKAQAEAHRWAKATARRHGEPTAIDQASFHARNILSIHRTYPRTGLLYQEWALFLSTIVIWARAYVSCTSGRRRPRLSISIPDPHWTKHSMLNMEKTILEILGREDQSVSSHEATSVLLWTKAQIERTHVSQNCGLTNYSLDVLERLATRGNEDGWFGDRLDNR